MCSHLKKKDKIQEQYKSRFYVHFYQWRAVQIFVCCIDRGAAWENLRFPAVEASYDYTCVYMNSWQIARPVCNLHTSFNTLVWGKCVEYFVLNAGYNLRVCSSSVDPLLTLTLLITMPGP